MSDKLLDRLLGKVRFTPPDCWEFTVTVPGLRDGEPAWTGRVRSPSQGIYESSAIELGGGGERLVFGR